MEKRIFQHFKVLLLSLALIASAPVRADGVVSAFLGMLGLDEKTRNECEVFLQAAQDATGKKGTDLAAKWLGKLRDASGFGHHTISSIDAGNGLSLAGIAGHFHGNKKVEGFTSEANRVLTLILKDTILSQHLAKQMVRLGLLQHTSRHFEYSKFLILAAHQDINLLDPRLNGVKIEDDIVQDYLKSLLKGIQAQNSESFILSAESLAVREQMLSDMFAGALEDMLPSDKENSLKSLDVAFTELSHMKPEELTPDKFNEVFDKLNATAEFVVRKFSVPSWIKPIINLLPGGSWIVGGIEYGERFANFFWKDSGLATSRRDVGKLDIWHKRNPKTLRIGFSSRDIRDLKPKVDAFITKYLNSYSSPTELSVYSNDFANDFLDAYPEVRRYFHLYVSREKYPDDERVGESYPGFDFEIQKILYKAANFFSLLKADSSSFPDISPEALASLRHQMIVELGLGDESTGQFNLDRIDLVFTSFVTSALGKARNALIDSIAEDFKIDEKVGGYDYNRRALFLLHHYRVLSYSFARQTEANQKFITEIMDQNFQSSLQELLRLEAPSENFELLHQLDATHLYFLFYQHLLSESKESHHRMTITPKILYRWIQLKTLLVNDTDKNISNATAYNNYVEWLTKDTDLDMRNAWDKVILRVATIMGLPPTMIPKLREYMELLTNDEKETFKVFFQRKNVFFHRASDLFKVMMMQNSNEDEFRDRSQHERLVKASMIEYLDAMKSIFAAIKKTETQFRKIEGANDTVHLFFKPVIERLQEDNNLTPIDLHKMTFELHHHNYGYVVHIVEPIR